MASHPYISGPGNVTQMIGYLKKNFPATVTADTVKKFGLASNNESYVINALQFIGIIDEEGKRLDRGHDVLTTHEEDSFQEKFAGLVKEAYKDLFDHHGEDTWSLPKSKLIGYFRTTDKTSEVIGGRQAGVFQAFAALAGHEPVGGSQRTQSPPRQRRSQPEKAAPAKPAPAKATIKQSPEPHGKGRRDMAMTVRIEINLPAEGSRETYDNIFQSIRANLLDE